MFLVYLVILLHYKCSLMMMMMMILCEKLCMQSEANQPCLVSE